MRFARRCWRSKEELAGNVLLWKLTHGHQPRGRPKKTYIDQLMDDTGCKIEELPIAVEDREGGGGVSWNNEQARPDDDDDDSYPN